MGQDKALVPFLGLPLIQRIIDRVAPIADELLITSNQPDALAFLGLPTVQDRLPGLGALGGLYTAFHSARYSFVAVVACDMPFVSAEMLAAERDAVVRGDREAVVPQTARGYEPFHAVYYRETCLAAVASALAAGKRRADCWFPDVRLGTFSPEQIARYDPAGEIFININTLEDLHRAEANAALLSERGS